MAMIGYAFYYVSAQRAGEIYVSVLSAVCLSVRYVFFYCDNEWTVGSIKLKL